MSQSSTFRAFLASSYRRPGAGVLEVGCGQGELTTALAVAGYEPLGIDPRACRGHLSPRAARGPRGRRRAVRRRRRRPLAPPHPRPRARARPDRRTPEPRRQAHPRRVRLGSPRRGHARVALRAAAGARRRAGVARRAAHPAGRGAPRPAQVRRSAARDRRPLRGARVRMDAVLAPHWAARRPRCSSGSSSRRARSRRSASATPASGRRAAARSVAVDRAPRRSHGKPLDHD